MSHIWLFSSKPHTAFNTSSPNPANTYTNAHVSEDDQTHGTTDPLSLHSAELFLCFYLCKNWQCELPLQKMNKKPFTHNTVATFSINGSLCVLEENIF